MSIRPLEELWVLYAKMKKFLKTLSKIERIQRYLEECAPLIRCTITIWCLLTPLTTSAPCPLPLPLPPPLPSLRALPTVLKWCKIYHQEKFWKSNANWTTMKKISTNKLEEKKDTEDSCQQTSCRILRLIY